MNVASILKSKGRAVSTVRPNATLLDITKKLAPKKIGAVIVVGDNGHVDGIISERDVIRALSDHGAQALSLTVSEVMTRTVVACQETSELDELMEMMTKGRFRHLPVIEDAALVELPRDRLIGRKLRTKKRRASEARRFCLWESNCLVRV
jgi:CBS domain-containing protein